MRRDLIIGILCSILIHAGLAGSGGISFDLFKKKKVVKEEAPVIQLEMPQMPPEPPEPTENSDTPADTTTLAPPSVADVPGVVNLDSFVQAVEPPPPPKAGFSLTVPKATGPAATGRLTEVFDLKNLDQAPVVRFRAQPVYPFDMKRLGINAEVLVEFICDSNGDVRNAFISKSDNHAFDSAALDAINKWKFRAGKKGGRSVNVRMSQPFDFRIEAE